MSGEGEVKACEYEEHKVVDAQKREWQCREGRKTRVREREAYPQTESVIGSDESADEREREEEKCEDYTMVEDGVMFFVNLRIGRFDRFIQICFSLSFGDDILCECREVEKGGGFVFIHQGVGLVGGGERERTAEAVGGGRGT